MNTVTFKSIPAMWNKEKDGRKPNTLRRIDVFDARFNILNRMQVEKIIMENTETGETFEREITDYTQWDGWAIISWKHEGGIGSN